ncbi:MAG: U32 family peptidase [Burkholderiaceae bacterium]|jgi:collagenase-like PrtC family protease|nr:U32 family peptidase [Burkholderiaceae bacterium]MEB2352291.1 U32 family peptidase [Burkholderiaceae bacterium]
MNPRIRLTVGPVLYYWPRKTLIDFYGQVADSPADTVVLGEVVCSRRHEMKLDDWLALARDLVACGKEVVLASQALLESESDLREMRRLVGQDEFLVEAGDASALRALAGRAFVLGPHVNVYSRPALQEHAALGAVRWVAPVELSLEAIGLINPAAAPVTGGPVRDTPIATELFAFGRLPLAFSARCFTARHYHLNKDECDFRCIEHPDGLLLSTGEGAPFLTLNGIQTQSAAQQCLIGDAAAMRAAGVSRVRLSPVAQRFADVLASFERVFNGNGNADEERAVLSAMSLPGGLVDGFAYRRPGLERSWTEGATQ